MGNSGYKLFVQIGNKFEPIDGLITGENLKPIIKTKLRDAIDKYLNTCTVRKCKKNQSNEKFDLNRMLDFMKSRGKEFVSDIKLDDFINLENFYLKKMKYASVLRRFGTYSHFFSMCIEWEFVHRSPMDKLKKGRVEDNHFSVWSKDEYSSVLKLCEGSRKAMFKFMWMTGCRPIEATSLKWSDINYDKKVLILRCGKNANISREFPLSDSLIDFFHNIKMDGNIVFSENKKEITTDSFYQYISHRLKKLKLKNLAPYGLRHTFATRLNNAGVNAFHIQFLLGHKDIKTTKRYVHSDMQTLMNSLKKIS